MSDSVGPNRQQPTRLPCPWDSPGKNTGVGCHFLLQCMKVKSESEVAQSCLTPSDPMDCSLPGSSVHGIFQARILKWGAIAFSRFVSYMIVYMFQCHSPKSSHPLPLPQSPWRPTRPFRTKTQRRCYFHYRGLECKSRKSRNTWSNRQIWPWNTKWSRAKTNRVLPR